LAKQAGCPEDVANKEGWELMSTEEIVIEGTRRDVFGHQVKALRREGVLPAVLYGKGIESIPVSMDARATQKVMTRVTASSLIKVVVDGEPYHTLLRERQMNYLTGDMIHLDFMVVSLTETVRTEVGLHIEGESPAVKDFNALLAVNINSVEVECLPTDLPNRISVDVSVLKAIGDSIRVRDLPIPPKVKILNDPQEMVVLVSAQSMEEEEELVVAPEGPVETEPVLIEKKRKEEVPGEGAEG
jgi:large subunit ribosomal protein L25